MLKNKFIKYLSAEKRFSEHTIISYSTDLDQFSIFLSEEYQISNEVSEISFQIVRSWIASLLEKGVTARSVNRKISTLKTYFKFLIRENVILESPMLKIVAPKSKKRLPVFIEENQILSSLIETPNDIESKYNISGGHWSHGDMEIDQLLMMRPFYGSSQYSTPINGLYLCSAGTHPGGGITGINGVNAAKQLLKDKGNG